MIGGEPGQTTNKHVSGRVKVRDEGTWQLFIVEDITFQADVKLSLSSYRTNNSNKHKVVAFVSSRNIY
jgi:hypothetical protein